MNKKGSSMEFIIIGLVIALVIATILIFVANEYIWGGAKKVASFTSCEKGVGGEGGVCILSTITCKNKEGFENPGLRLGGCPSEITKRIYGRKEASKYSQCCVLEYCEEANLFELKGEKYNSDNIKMCLGYSKTCTKTNKCCCVKDLPKLK